MFLAWKEMRRAKVRFGLLTGAVALLVLLILFLQALSSGLIEQFIGAIQHQSADVLVYDAQARKSLEGSIVLPTAQAAVATVPGVAVAAPFGEATFTVRAGGKEQDAVIIGYQLGGPGEPTTLSSGRLPNADDEAVASSRNTGDGFGIGSTVEVVPPPGQTGSRTFHVVGLADEINYSVAPVLFTAFDSYSAAKKFVNPDATEVLPSVIAVRVAPGSSPAAVAAAIAAAVPGVEALTRQQAVDGSPGVGAVRQSFNVILLLFYLVVPLVTGLFFLIVTFQKAGALTLLRAIGARAAPLVRSLLLQVVVVVVVGAAIATGIFALIASSSGGSRSLSISVDPLTVTLTVTAILVLALLTALVAVRRVLRIDPIAATTGGGVSV